MADNMRALSTFVTTGASNFTEAVTYYEGLKALLVADGGHDWYQTGDKNQFGDDEFYLTQDKLEHIRDEYFESLIHNKAPRKAFTSWLVQQTATPNVFTSGTHATPRPTTPAPEEGESK